MFAYMAYKVEKKISIFHKAPIICRTMGRGEWELVLNVNENFIYERYY